MAERVVENVDIVPRSALEAIVAVINQISTEIAQLTAKLDADAGVTDTNYAALIVTDTIAVKGGTPV